MNLSRNLFKRPSLNLILLAFEIFIFNFELVTTFQNTFLKNSKEECHILKIHIVPKRCVLFFMLFFLRWKNLFLMTLHVIDEDQCLIMLMKNVGNFYIIPQTGWYIILRCFHDARSDASPWFLIHIKRFLRDNKGPQAVFRIPTEKQFLLHLVLS